MNAAAWWNRLCGTAFMPHGQCYLWDPNMLRLQSISDGLIALAYFSIPFMLVYFVRKRSDLPHRAIFLLFGAFIVACGATHLMEVVLIWNPLYWISGWLKAVTAAISLGTAFALMRSMPDALALPSPAQLTALNAALEERVRARTSELRDANAALQAQIEQRMSAESEVRRLNVSLLASLDEMRTLLDVIPIGIAIAEDVDCRKVRANRALAAILAAPHNAAFPLSGYLEASPTNFKVLANGSEVRREDLPMLVAARENRPVLDFTMVIDRTDGARLEVLANAVPLQDERGQSKGCVATFQDVTAQRQMETHAAAVNRKLMETQKLESLGVLAGGIAHDFNNLLTSILGYASLTRRELPPASPMLENLEQIETAGHRAADLCRQMLAYSGKGRFVIQRVDLNELVQGTTHLLSISIGKNCVLRFNLAPTLPPLSADATQLRQIIMNLVINASEAIGARSGIIAVTTGVARVDEDYSETLLPPDRVTPGDYVFLEISDNGCGMDRATLGKIFDPFFTTKFTGRGLGLAAVLGIIRGHRGGLKVYSEPTKGTTFKILLPCDESAPETVAGNSSRAPASWRGQGRVLVVDDEESVRAVSARILESVGLTTTLAMDGREAVELYRRDPAAYALVLMDLTMPHLDGEETFRQLRHLNPAVRVVLMSGFNQQDAVDRFSGKGLAGFVQKPFEAGQLTEAVRSALLES